MKIQKKLLLAASTLGLAFTATVGSTYAWFAANTNVTVTGMSTKTQVSGNILIAGTNSEASYSTSLEQARTALIEPASTVDGVNFYYTVNANGTGAAAGTGASKYATYSEATAQSNTYANKTAYDADFNTDYGVQTPAATAYGTAYAYIDYSFYLKATASEANSKLSLTTCNFLYNETALSATKAWRVAVFAVSTSANTEVTDVAAAVSGNRKTILAMNSAANQESGKAVSSTSATAAVTYGTAADIATGIAAGTTVYYKVVVRLWLEGEDTTCTTDIFAALTNAFSLSLTFSLGTSVTGVTEIGSVAA